MPGKYDVVKGHQKRRKEKRTESNGTKQTEYDVRVRDGKDYNRTEHHLIRTMHNKGIYIRYEYKQHSKQFIIHSFSLTYSERLTWMHILYTWLNISSEFQKSAVSVIWTITSAFIYLSVCFYSDFVSRK